MKRRSSTEIEDLIASGQRLVKEAEEAIEESERFFAEHNLDPRDAIEFVRKHAGEAAVQQIEETVRETIEQLERDFDLRRIQGTKTRRPGQRVRMRSDMV